LEGLHIGRIHPHHVGNVTRQEITEQTEAAPEHGFRSNLPRNRSSRLQDRQWSRKEQVREVSLDRIAEWLIYIVRNSIERSPKACHLIMRTERVRIESVPDANRPCQLLRDLPCILRVKIDVQKIEWLVRIPRKRLGRGGSHAVNELGQVRICDDRNCAFAEIEVIQVEYSNVRPNP
jgi:hypothetical protein